MREKVEGGLLGGVAAVTCDMGEGSVTAAQETLGTGIRVTIDRFHVRKTSPEQLESLHNKR